MEAFTAVSLPATDEGAEDGLSACAVLSSGKASEVLGMPLEEAAVAAGFEAEYPFSFFSVFSAVFSERNEQKGRAFYKACACANEKTFTQRTYRASTFFGGRRFGRHDERRCVSHKKWVQLSKKVPRTFLSLWVSS